MSDVHLHHLQSFSMQKKKDMHAQVPVRWWLRFIYLLYWQCVKNRWHSFVPAPGRAGPRGLAPFIVLKKKAITMLMCRSRRVNPTRAGKQRVKGWWRERSHCGLTAKRRQGSVSYQTHTEEKNKLTYRYSLDSVRIKIDLLSIVIDWTAYYWPLLDR